MAIAWLFSVLCWCTLPLGPIMCPLRCMVSHFVVGPFMVATWLAGVSRFAGEARQDAMGAEPHDTLVRAASDIRRAAAAPGVM